MTYTTNRRRFLVQLGTAAAAGASTPLWFDLVKGGGLPFAWGAGESDVLAPGSPICVHVVLDGGNDYLNTLVDVNDGFYNSPTVGHGAIALTATDTLALTGTNYRLHKSLAWLANRWNTTGDVGFVLGVGNTKQNFSHFNSMKFWSTGRADMAGNTGWLGRYADLTHAQNPLGSISIENLRADAVGTAAPALVVENCEKFNYSAPWLNSNVFLNSAQQMANRTGTAPADELAKMMNTTFQLAGRIQGAANPTITNITPSPAWVTRQLLQAALLIRAGMPSQTYTLAFGSFDSHAQQKQMQTTRFTELNEGLTKFFAALAGHERARDVFVLITSEFGRQATATEDLGTDHGQAGMAMFIGGGTRRGVYGQAPTLDPGGPTAPNRVSDALIPTLDFRSVHATALARLAKDDTNVADSVLNGHYENLGVFSPWTPPSPTTTTTTTAPTTTTVANKAPTAAMTLNKTFGPVPLTVGASGSGSKDVDGTITKYTWGWGDGTAATYGVSATHKFTKRGTFTVRLTVTDNKGASGTVTKTVRVV